MALFGFSGDGSYGDPYIIENLVLNGSDGQEYGLFFKDFHNYTIIKNCTFFEFRDYAGATGFYSRNASKITLYNCTFKDSVRGITLIQDCFNHTFYNNTIKNTTSAGVYLKESWDNIFYDNSLYDCFFDVHFDPISYDDKCLYNNVSETNLIDGKPIYYWVDKHNDAIPANASQVFIVNCSFINVSDLIFKDVPIALMLGHSSNCTINNLTILNSEEPIRVYNNCSDNVIENCHIENHTRYFAIELYNYCDNNNITRNMIIRYSSYAVGGIKIHSYCLNNNISHNYISGLQNGIRLSWWTNNSFVYNNVVEDCYGDGLYFYEIYHSIIYYNYIFDNGDNIDYSEPVGSGPVHFNYSQKGNYWGDYETQNPGASNNGIFWNESYEIDSGLNKYDYFPLSSMDFDNDSLWNYYEIVVYNTKVFDNDTDADEMPDGWEVNYTLNPLQDDSGGDPDTDILINVYEFGNGTDPHNPDTDSDGMNDGMEIEKGYDPLVPDGFYEDLDGDNVINLYEFGNGTDPNKNDTDGDLLDDLTEILGPTSPINNDTDVDGMLDGWETFNDLNATKGTDNLTDDDDDNVINLYEFLNGTNPQSNDTDVDGMLDGWEIFNSLDPLFGDDNITDADGDKVLNIYEYGNYTDPHSSDSDLDGMADLWEIVNLLNATKGTDNITDADGDGLSNLEEYLYFSNPQVRDTDNDGYLDGWEIANGYDPLDPNSHPSKESSDEDDQEKQVIQEEKLIMFAIAGVIGGAIGGVISTVAIFSIVIKRKSVKEKKLELSKIPKEMNVETRKKGLKDKNYN